MKPDPKVLIEYIKGADQFDHDWYLETYPDVAALALDPAEHYFFYGARLGRDPGPNFSTSKYLEKFPDLERTQQNPLLHVLGIDQDVFHKEPKTPPLPSSSPKVIRSPILPPMVQNGDVMGNESEDFARETLRAYQGPKTLRPNIDYPRVSVVITSYNAFDTIERSVLSILNQDYPNLEVVVVDDNSQDKVWSLLQAMKQQSPRALQIIRCNVNGGTYLAKNIGVHHASGDIILFQDSDDYSHPARVSVQVLPLIEDPSLIATRTMYLRFKPDTGKIIPVAGKPSKLGLITLAVRKRAFDEMGYFDAVRRAGDDEWFQRLIHLYGAAAIRDVTATLYLAELRENSLVADMISFNADGSVEQSSSVVRKEYVKQFKERFAQHRSKAWYAENFPASPIRPAQTYPDTVAALPALAERVIGNACCIPSRVDSFAKTVARILPQVDELNVFLDKFDTVPAYLQNNPKINVLRSQSVKSDPRDNYKFFAFNRNKSSGKPFYYFTFDDDILYPHDYARTMINRLVQYKNRTVATVHGVMYQEYPAKYFRNRYVYHFQDQALERPQLVNNAGTGTVAFHSDLFDQIHPDEWPRGGMVDIFFANLCCQKNIPIVCIDRHANWLRSTEESEGTPNLFTEYAQKEALIIAELQKHIPWGYKAIERVLMHFPNPLRQDVSSLLPRFHNDTEISLYFHRLR